MNHPRLRQQPWLYKKERSARHDNLTGSNKNFLEKRVEADFGPRVLHKGFETFESASLLKVPSLQPVTWQYGMQRTGTIARKLGHYPLYLKDGTRINTTVLQLVDNHVVKCFKAGEYNPSQRDDTYKASKRIKNRSCLLVGSESMDPNALTANYIGLFKGSGVPPTKYLCRFEVSPGFELPPGTPLNVTHYRVGDYIDARAKT